MRISTLLVLASMTTAIACGGDDSDDTAGTATDSATMTTSMTDPSATDPSSGTDPSATDPSATDPSATDPSATDPSATDPTDTDPSSGTDPTDTDPSSGTDPTLDTTGGDANCELYCSTFIAVCQDGAEGLDGADPYADMDSCMTTCGGFELGTEGDTSGNTLACRGYHLGAAVAMPDMGHCGHADADGSGVCV